MGAALLSPAGRRWAKAIFTSAKAAQNYSTATAVPWEGVAADTGGFWSAGSPTRLTVPAGVSAVQVGGNMEPSGVTNGIDVHLFITKNGSDNWHRANMAITSPPATDAKISIASGPEFVVAGDYFELFYRNVGDTDVSFVIARCGFWIAELR